MDSDDEDDVEGFVGALFLRLVVGSVALSLWSCCFKYRLFLIHAPS